MILHYIAAVLLIFAIAQHTLSGGFSDFLRKHADIDEVGQIRKHDPNAVLAITALLILLAGVLISIIVPGVFEEVEIGVGLLVFLGAIAALLHRRPRTLRPFVFLTAGALILAGNLI